MVPLEDVEISTELAKAYKKLGVTVHDRDQGRVDRRHRREGQGHRVAGGRRRVARCSRPTRCCRRSASRPGPRATAWTRPASSSPTAGAIDIDDYMRTNVPHIYAIGDCTAKLMLAHLAEAQGIVAAETIAGAETIAIDYDMVPAGDVLPAADRLLRLLRAAGEGQGVRRQDREVPLHGQRQGPRARRRDRLRQDHRRRQARRAPRCRHDRTRRHRAAAGADPGAALGSHRRRGRPATSTPTRRCPRRSRKPPTASPAT